MPVLPNPKHELFCQALAQGKTYVDAYEAAGFKPNRHNAHTLKQRSNIQERLSELLEARRKKEEASSARAVERAAITKQWVLEQLVDNAKKAKEAGQMAPANRALELIGRELGMFIERREVGEPGEFDRLDASELRAAIAARLGVAGARDGAARGVGEQGGVRGKPH